MAGERARASGWAARTAAALAQRWPGPRHTVLVDLDVAQPSLHQLTGVANDEGVIDVVEFGASLHRIAVPAADARFDVLPAGPFGGEGERALLESDAWLRILRDAAARRETLLLYTPAEAPGSTALVQRAGAVLVLAEGAETQAIVEQLPHRYSVLAVLEPQRTASDAAASPARATEGAAIAAESLDEARMRVAGGRERRDALIADLRRRQRAARLTQRAVRERVTPAVRPAEPTEAQTSANAAAAVPATGDVVAEARVESALDGVTTAPLESPEALPVRRARRQFVHPIGWTLGVVALLSLFAGSLHFLAGRFGGPAEVATPQPEPAESPAVPVAPPLPDRNAVPYAVALEAHPNLARAFERVDALQANQPDLSFYVAPFERDGVLHYHVLAGPVADSAAALALRDTLLVRRVKTMSTPSDVRYTPLALLIGDYSARADADEQLAELRRLDIPAYVVVGLAADSALLYRVFVGGFAGPAEAEVPRQLLRHAGVRDHLVTRTRSSHR